MITAELKLEQDVPPGHLMNSSPSRATMLVSLGQCVLGKLGYLENDDMLELLCPICGLLVAGG